jgi:hypothetical protein
MNAFWLLLAVSLGVMLLTPHMSFAYFYQQGIASTGQYIAIVKTDKASYSGGPIVISGEVKPYDKGRELKVVILSSAKKIITAQKVPVNPDGTFSLVISDMVKFKKDTYKVLAQYGIVDMEVGTASFSFDDTKHDKKSDVKKKPKKTTKPMSDYAKSTCIKPEI